MAAIVAGAGCVGGCDDGACPFGVRDDGAWGEPIVMVGGADCDGAG